MIFEPHSKFRQDVVPQGVTELQDLKDWGKREPSGTSGTHRAGAFPSLWREPSSSVRLLHTPEGPGRPREGLHQTSAEPTQSLPAGGARRPHLSSRGRSSARLP